MHYIMVPRSLTAVAVCLLATVEPARAYAQENILRNSDLTLGKDAPDSWSNEVWQKGADFTTFNWKHTAGAPGEVEIPSLKPNDASWEPLWLQSSSRFTDLRWPPP